MSSSRQQKAKASVLGAFVADAASNPLHWIYDIPKINELLQSNQRQANPEFFPIPSCPFYKSSVGKQSCYGEELIPLLRSMAENDAELDAVKYSEAIKNFYTAVSPDSYRNKSIRSVMVALEEGKQGVACGDTTDFQANCISKVPIVVARYAGSPDLLEKVELAIRVQQNNDDAVKYGLSAAKILEKVVLGSSLEDALEWAKSTSGGLLPEIQELVRRAIEASKTPPKELTFEPAPYMKGMMEKHMAMKDQLEPFTWAVWCHGPACGNPPAFLNVIMNAAAFGHSSSGSGFVEGVRKNMVAGGDNCSRACLVGALLGAQYGLDAIPEEWRKKTDDYEEFSRWADTLVQAKP